jgi:hypothetical protein
MALIASGHALLYGILGSADARTHRSSRLNLRKCFGNAISSMAVPQRWNRTYLGVPLQNHLQLGSQFLSVVSDEDVRSQRDGNGAFRIIP